MSPLALPEPGTPPRPARTPSRCSASAREPTTPTSTSTTPTPPRSRRSAGASTGCRWRSSSRPPAADCCQPTEIAERLDTALGAPGAGARDAPARQQTLRATIDWSHDVAQRRREAVLRALRRCSPAARPSRRPRRSPPAGWTRSTAWSPRACSRDAGTRSRPTRLGMLETIRAYAGERFASAADAEAVREAHYRYYLALAQRHGTDRALRGAERPGAPRTPGRRDRQPPRGARLGDRAARAPNGRSRWRRRSAATGSCETATPTPWTGSSGP